MHLKLMMDEVYPNHLFETYDLSSYLISQELSLNFPSKTYCIQISVRPFLFGRGGQLSLLRDLERATCRDRVPNIRQKWSLNSWQNGVARRLKSFQLRRLALPLQLLRTWVRLLWFAICVPFRRPMQANSSWSQLCVGFSSWVHLEVNRPISIY